MPRYEFSDGKSNKFWEIELDGSEVTTRWGRIGTDGQSKTKPFGDAAAAQKEHDKLVKQKTKKGYALVGPPQHPKLGLPTLQWTSSTPKSCRTPGPSIPTWCWQTTSPNRTIPGPS